MSLDFPTSIGWLFLDLNSYFASVEQQLRPELRGRPVAVVPLETDATCAIAASYEAKAYGVRTGTRIFEAKHMCPELICVRASHERYTRFHHAIIEAVEREIPVSHVASIDEMACELDRSERNAETARALAMRDKQSIYRHVGEHIHCSIGIAPNRFLAKIATELHKPNGLVVIEPEDIPGALLDLDFDDIPGLGRAMQHRLYRAGISTMRDLYQLSPKHMRALWHNVGGERMWYQLRGVELEREPTQRRTVGHSHVLAPEFRPLKEATPIAQRLLAKAVSRMRRLGYAATSMTLSLRIEDGPRMHADRRFHALRDHISLLREWQEVWALLIQRAESHSTHLRIKKLSVTLHGLVGETQIQADLFDDLHKQDEMIQSISAPNATSQEAPQQTADSDASENDYVASQDLSESGHPWGAKSQEPAKSEKLQKYDALSEAMDRLNQRYGRGTVITASTLGEVNRSTGTKIAFSRIPDLEEFKE